jgi:hypothetical protein
VFEVISIGSAVVHHSCYLHLDVIRGLCLEDIDVHRVSGREAWSLGVRGLVAPAVKFRLVFWNPIGGEWKWCT